MTLIKSDLNSLNKKQQFRFSVAFLIRLEQNFYKVERRHLSMLNLSQTIAMSRPFEINFLVRWKMQINHSCLPVKQKEQLFSLIEIWSEPFVD